MNVHMLRNREYYLILPVKSGPEYGGGWAPGSVLAHWIHLKKGFSGVFWVWGLTSSGILYEDKPHFEELIDPLGKSFKVNNTQQICISRKGFFYESENHSIAWEFKADFILKDAELSSEAAERLQKVESYIPFFRKKYLKPKPRGSWLLIRDLKRLTKPILGKRARRDSLYSFLGFKYFSNTENKIVNLTTSHLASGNAFVLAVPENIRLINPNPELEASEYLRQFLSDNPPKSGLRESNIHDALIFQLLSEGYYFLHEKPVGKGRYDILFQDKSDRLIAIEIKLRKGDSAVDQLLDYIRDLKKQKQYENEEIKGAIVCGQADDSLRDTAKSNGFDVIEYVLSIKIPLDKIT